MNRRGYLQLVVELATIAEDRTECAAVRTRAKKAARAVQELHKAIIKSRQARRQEDVMINPRLAWRARLFQLIQESLHE